MQEIFRDNVDRAQNDGEELDSHYQHTLTNMRDLHKNLYDTMLQDLVLEFNTSHTLLSGKIEQVFEGE